MKEFYEFASENPILTLFLASMVLTAIVRLIPWSKCDDGG